MFIHRPGHRLVAFEGEGAGAGGGADSGAGGGTDGGAGGAHPVAPWSTAGDGMWTIGEEGKQVPWYAAIPEEKARAHIEAKVYKNPGELALANYSLTQLQRGDPTVVGLPGKDASSEDMKAFYRKIGAPDTPEGYEFSFAEGVQVDDKFTTFGRNAFHEAGLRPDQAQIIADKWNEFAAQLNGDKAKADAEANDAALTALEQKWGGSYEENVAAGKRVVNALGLSNEMLDRLGGKMGDADVVELMAMIGKKAGEGDFLSSQQTADPTTPEGMTPEDAQKAITRLQGDKDFQAKYTDRKHPEHKDAVSYMQRLFARI